MIDLAVCLQFTMSMPSENEKPGYLLLFENTQFAVHLYSTVWLYCGTRKSENSGGAGSATVSTVFNSKLASCLDWAFLVILNWLWGWM